MEDRLTRIEQKLDTLLKEKQETKKLICSPSLNELATSLALAQADFLTVAELEHNSHNEKAFASLLQIQKATIPALSKHGLSLTQVKQDYDDGSCMLHTRLLHKTDQFIESQIRMRPNNNEPNALSSYEGWLKREAWASIIGFPTYDDDAERYMATQRTIPALGASKRKDASYEVISQDQYSELEYELDGFPNIVEEILKEYNLVNLRDLPKDKYRACITQIRVLKNRMRGN